MLMSCVIGIFPNERHRKQPVTIDLCLYLNTRKAAKSTSIHDTIDYAAAVEEVTFILEQCEFLLIESAVEVVCQFFLTTYTASNLLPQVDAVMVRISKPSALTHGIVPAVQIARRRGLSELPAPESIDIHVSDQGSLTVGRLAAGSEVRISSAAGFPRAALTIGKWSKGGLPLKPRTVVTSQSEEASLTHSLTLPQLILLRH